MAPVAGAAVFFMRASQPERRPTRIGEPLNRLDVGDVGGVDEEGRRLGHDREAGRADLELRLQVRARARGDRTAAERGERGAVIVSGELGVGKPDASVFRAAVDELGADEAVMIGDSLGRHIDGALACGLRAVWINRFGSGPGRDVVPEIPSLAELPAVRGYDA